MMGLINFMRNKIRSFLKIDSSLSGQVITIKESLDYYGNAVKNRIWYRGSGQEIAQLYAQTDCPPTAFWKASATRGMEMRKIHTGLPKLIVKSLVNIVINDYNGVEFTDQPILEDMWNGIADSNKIDKVIKKCVNDCLIVGDGAFKITFDKDISEEHPIIEFIPGEYVEYNRRRGRIYEIVFITEYMHNSRRYFFRESYGYGYIKYSLQDENGGELPLNFIPQTNWCDSGGVSFDKSVILAVPAIYGESSVYDGRGESIYEGKTDSFDALDEAWSQWMDALRAGRSKQYIPECLIPRDPDTGKLQSPNPFDNRFIAIGNDVSENGGNKIYTEQPGIPHESYLSTYITALDLCLQGVISPSTLGIDVKKLDNAEAQREKEKATLYTRGNIIEMLSEVIPSLVASAVAAKQLWNKAPVDMPKVNVKFGEYANPSFESQVETISKAKSGGIMSIEASVDELYGDSRDDDWKAKEIERLKEEQGITTLKEPSASDDVDIDKLPEPEKEDKINGV